MSAERRSCPIRPHPWPYAARWWAKPQGGPGRPDERYSPARANEALWTSFVTGGSKESFQGPSVKGSASNDPEISIAAATQISRDYPSHKLFRRHPEMRLGAARERAREARGEIGDGGDPIADKKALEASQTAADLVENYIARHAATKRSGTAIARRLRKNVKDVIGAVKLAELHRRDITRCIDAVKDRGAGVEANRVFEDIRAMVRWARGRGDLDENLVEGMRRPTETTDRDRVLTADEIKTMWAALPDADMSESTRRILRLLLIMAQRESEIAGMMKIELDLPKRIWTIPGARTKNKQEHVPLPDMAISIIQEQIEAAAALAKRKGRKPPPFVFPGPGGARPSPAPAFRKP